MYASIATRDMKIAHCKPQEADTNKIASRKVKPIVVGLTRISRKYTQTIARTIAAERAKRTICRTGLLTRQDCS